MPDDDAAEDEDEEEASPLCGGCSACVGPPNDEGEAILPPFCGDAEDDGPPDPNGAPAAATAGGKADSPLCSRLVGEVPMPTTEGGGVGRGNTARATSPMCMEGTLGMRRRTEAGGGAAAEE